jgi:ribosome maturation factor RimP
MEKNQIAQAVNEIICRELSEKEIFIVDIEIKSGNQIDIILDSDSGINISDCAAINQYIEQKFDRDVEDYELTVASAGLSSPFKITRQYKKYIGKEINIQTQKGEKIICTLTKVTEDGIEAEETKKIKIENSKKKEIVTVQQQWKYTEIKKALPHINFNKK